MILTGGGAMLGEGTNALKSKIKVPNLEMICANYATLVHKPSIVHHELSQCDSETASWQRLPQKPCEFRFIAPARLIAGLVGST